MPVLKRSTIQLLRFPFSFFLMPVFWFALLFVDRVQWHHTILLFFIIHVLMYPASNAYNSYMDNDTESIGGITQPLPPTKQLYYVALVMDILAFLLAMWIGIWVGCCILVYIIFSRLYSYRGVRLKKYPVVGFLTVILNQGGLIFLTVYLTASVQPVVSVPVMGICIAILFIGGFYPITQVYQHAADKADGVTTLSVVLGIKGTFLFCMAMYALAFLCMWYYFTSIFAIHTFIMIQLFFVPVLIYFFYWIQLVWKNVQNANFKQTMRMNWIAATFTNMAFIFVFIQQHIG
ncbi:UbiA family prenyltransferase [Hydrotalea flava]|uniref:UbiA family prenyltransferase n=1 Tax=Hydrotalea flava TaxID=714549 RepID=UPI00082D5CC7|nr:UbiA family prenyltransferase [Hydrotalea flava]